MNAAEGNAGEGMSQESTQALYKENCRLSEQLEELKAKRAINWSLVIPFVTAIITAGATIGLGIWTEWLKIDQKKLDFEADIIKKSAEGGLEKSRNNLEFFIVAGLLPQYGEGIKRALGKGLELNLNPNPPPGPSRLEPYGALKGKIVNMKASSEKSPHVQIHISDGEAAYRAAINIGAQDGSPIRAAKIAIEDDAMRKRLLDLRPGVTLALPKDVAARLDYFHHPVLAAISTWVNDGSLLVRELETRLRSSTGSDRVGIVVYGLMWGLEERRDQFFGFVPGRGVHDVHLNQGYPKGPFYSSNATWQDGAVFIIDNDTKNIDAYLFAYGRQCLDSDAADGFFRCRSAAPTE